MKLSGTMVIHIIINEIPDKYEYYGVYRRYVMNSIYFNFMTSAEFNKAKFLCFVLAEESPNNENNRT